MCAEIDSPDSLPARVYLQPEMTAGLAEPNPDTGRMAEYVRFGPPSGGEVRVKALVWEGIGYGWAKTAWGGYTITDRYDLHRNDEAFGWEHSSRVDGDRSEEAFESIGAAKAAAQADYEARILAALATPST